MPPSTSPDSAAIVVRVPVDAKEQLLEQARRNDRSLSAEVRRILREGLEDDDD